jgi:hypothetical protein
LELIVVPAGMAWNINNKGKFFRRVNGEIAILALPFRHRNLTGPSVVGPIDVR